MKTLLLLFTFCLFLSCKKEKTIFIPCSDPTNNKETSNILFQGNWEWVSELVFDQRAGHYTLLTPNTNGYTRQLIFRNFSELEYLKNNITTGKYRYSIDNENTITGFPDDVTPVLVYKTYSSGIYDNYVHFSVCNDTLVLNFQMTNSIKGIEKWVKN